jgi:hypothetical protein
MIATAKAKGSCFVTRFRQRPGRYADLGSAYESYANQWYLEMESMAPLETIEVGGSSVHFETWDAFATDAAPDPRSDDELHAFAANSPILRVSGGDSLT